MTQRSVTGLGMSRDNLLLEALVHWLTPPHDIGQMVALYAKPAGDRGDSAGSWMERVGLAGARAEWPGATLWWPDTLTPWSYGGSAWMQGQIVAVAMPQAMPPAAAVFDEHTPLPPGLRHAIWVPIRSHAAVAGVFTAEWSADCSTRIGQAVAHAEREANHRERRRHRAG